MSLTLPIKRCHSWAGYRTLPSSPFKTLALSSAAELVGVARPRCGGSVTRESDLSNGENDDISIGRLHAAFAEAPLWNAKPPRFDVFARSRGLPRMRSNNGTEKLASHRAKRAATILKATLANNAARHLRQRAGQCHRPPG